MMLFGVTGGIGMGKSTAAGILSSEGVPVIDTDALARKVVEIGQPALAELAGRFGPTILSPDGALIRSRLAEIVFSDAEARKWVESILHPRIRNLWKGQVDELARMGHPLAAVVIPLLFETNAEGEFDSIICVACSPDAQRTRLRERGWSDEHIRQRLDAQWPVEKKMGLADVVIWTEGPVEVTASQLRKVLRRFRQSS